MILIMTKPRDLSFLIILKHNSITKLLKFVNIINLNKYLNNLDKYTDFCDFWD